MKKNPEKVIELAVKGMLPKNRLGRQMFKKLRFTVDQNINMKLKSQKYMKFNW